MTDRRPGGRKHEVAIQPTQHLQPVGGYSQRSNCSQHSKQEVATASIANAASGCYSQWWLQPVVATAKIRLQPIQHLQPVGGYSQHNNQEVQQPAQQPGGGYSQYSNQEVATASTGTRR